MPEGVDFLGANSTGQVVTQGPVAYRLLQSNMNVGALRTNAALRKNEWELLDQTVVEVARQRLVVTGDLISRGLVFNVPNGLGTTIIQHETQSEMTAAQVSMDGVTRGQNDRVTFNLVSTPLPIIHKDFMLTARALAASRNLGTPLDTTQTAEATRQVSETIEDMVINGLSSGGTLGFGSSTATLYGIKNYTNRNTVSLSTNWDASGKTGPEILADVLAMITALQSDKMFGPYVLYIPTAYSVILDDDYQTTYGKTIRQRILEIPSITAVMTVDKLAANNVLMVQLSKDVIDMVVGLQPTTVQWETEGGMVMYFKVMAIMVPRPKSDANSNCGIAHLS